MTMFVLVQQLRFGDITSELEANWEQSKIHVDKKTQERF